MNPNPHLAHLLSAAYSGDLASSHLAHLAKAGITIETARLHGIRSVPLYLLAPLLGFGVPADVESAMLFPFPDPRGGHFDYVKVRTFPDQIDVRGDDVVGERRELGRYRYNAGRRKYLVRRRAQPRLYFPIPTMRRALEGDEPLWIVEGMKKGLALAQLGLPAIAIESAWAWHAGGSRELIPDFDVIAIKGRTVKVTPDPDAYSNPEIARAMHRLAEALERRGACVQIVMLPTGVTAA